MEETILVKLLASYQQLIYQQFGNSISRHKPKGPSSYSYFPNKLIPTINDIEDCDELMLSRLFTVVNMRK